MTAGLIAENRGETIGAAEGTAGTAMLGGGGAVGAAFLAPLGSLIELLIPPTLPGPRGMPLTPASPEFCADEAAGAATNNTNTAAIALPTTARS